MNDLTTYKQYKEFMKTGDSFLYVGKSPLGRTIRWWVKTFFKSHGDPIFGHGNMCLRFSELDGKENRRWVLDARASGVYPVLFSDYLAEYDGQCWWYPLKDCYDFDRNSMLCYAMELAGKKYDLIGLFKNALGRVNAHIRKVFCTESIFLTYRDGAKIVEGEKAPRPDQVPYLTGIGANLGQIIFKSPVRLV